MNIYENDDLAEIKERIYQEGLIEFVLQELECQNIKRVHSRYEAQLPLSFNSNNMRAVQVYDSEHLTSSVRNKGIKGDIYTLVGFILFDAKDFDETRKHLNQIKAWLCNTLEWEEYITRNRDTTFEERVNRKDHLSFLRNIQKERKKTKNRNSLFDKQNQVLNSEEVFSRYFDEVQYNFLKDGILPETQKEFQIMYDRDSERITIPIHNKHGELIGVKGRYIGSNKKILDSVKYLYLYRCDKSIELFNLHRAYEHIKEKKEVIVFESEKSCMLSWQYGYKNCVAICGNDLSPVQAMLLKQLEVDVVFAFDEDIEWQHIKSVTRQIKSRICKAIIDEDNLLSEKQSPVDKGKTVWEMLYHKYKKSVR